MNSLELSLQYCVPHSNINRVIIDATQNVILAVASISTELWLDTAQVHDCKQYLLVYVLGINWYLCQLRAL